MRLLIILSIVLMSSIQSFSQNLDQEPEFIYRKATYLLETNRYDEAVKELNKIIASNPAYKDVLYQRAFAKFNLAAYAGTKQDLMSSFDVVGISPEAVLLFGKTQKNLGEVNQSKQTMATADILFPNGTTPRKKTENSRSQDTDDGSEDKSDLKKIEEKISQILDDIIPKEERNQDQGNDDGPTTRRDDPNREPTTRDEDDGTGNDRIVIVDEPVEPVYEEDTSEREIVVDEDLTLIIKNGLGARRIAEEPSILMLAQTSGKVVVDVCVNGSGKVTTAEYNSDESTLRTQSLITLAVRKSKEFFFADSSQDEMCGTIVFQITGSN